MNILTFVGKMNEHTGNTIENIAILMAYRSSADVVMGRTGQGKIATLSLDSVTGDIKHILMSRTATVGHLRRIERIVDGEVEVK